MIQTRSGCLKQYRHQLITHSFSLTCSAEAVSPYMPYLPLCLWQMKSRQQRRCHIVLNHTIWAGSTAKCPNNLFPNRRPFKLSVISCKCLLGWASDGCEELVYTKLMLFKWGIFFPPFFCYIFFHFKMNSICWCSRVAQLKYFGHFKVFKQGSGYLFI